MKFNLACCAMVALFWTFPTAAVGDTDSKSKSRIDTWQFQTSAYTAHFDSDPEHNNHPHLIDVEAWTSNNWLYGLAIFDNSFGQPSQYLYAGYHWSLFKTEHVYFKITGGLLHGYKNEYKNKIPLNDLGVAPAIVPSIGVRYRWAVTELQLLGNSAITVTAGLRF